MFATAITPKSITITMDGLQRTIRDTHPKWADTRTLLLNMSAEKRVAPDTGEQDKLIEWLDFPRHLAVITNGRVTVTNKGRVLLDGIEVGAMNVGAHLAQRVIQMFNEGFDIEPLCRFIERLDKNPDKDVKRQLFQWLEACNTPLTPRGTFLAYKYVRADLKSSHDGKTQHVIGEELWMRREDCDPDPNNTCSRGLHFAGWDYVAGSGPVKLILEIDPEHVVSVPVDYGFQKGRACRYTPIAKAEQDDLTGKSVADPVPPAEQFAEETDSNYDDGDGYGDYDWGGAGDDDHFVDPVIADAVTQAPVQATVPPPAEKPKHFEYRGVKVKAARIEKAVEKEGSINSAARYLGIPRTTLQGWFKKLKGG